MKQATAPDMSLAEAAAAPPLIGGNVYRIVAVEPLPSGMGV
jgi:hypothetical protein